MATPTVPVQASRLGRTTLWIAIGVVLLVVLAFGCLLALQSSGWLSASSQGNIPIETTDTPLPTLTTPPIDASYVSPEPSTALPQSAAVLQVTDATVEVTNPPFGRAQLMVSLTVIAPDTHAAGLVHVSLVYTGSVELLTAGALSVRQTQRAPNTWQIDTDLTMNSLEAADLVFLFLARVPLPQLENLVSFQITATAPGQRAVTKYWTQAFSGQLGLRIWQQSVPSSVTSGDWLTYTFYLTNTGSVGYQVLRLWAQLPAGVGLPERLPAGWRVEDPASVSQTRPFTVTWEGNWPPATSSGIRQGMACSLVVRIMRSEPGTLDAIVLTPEIKYADGKEFLPVPAIDLQGDTAVAVMSNGAPPITAVLAARLAGALRTAPDDSIANSIPNSPVTNDVPVQVLARCTRGDLVWYQVSVIDSVPNVAGWVKALVNGHPVLTQLSAEPQERCP